jgi:hypothetical protein
MELDHKAYFVMKKDGTCKCVLKLNLWPLANYVLDSFQEHNSSTMGKIDNFHQ